MIDLHQWRVRLGAFHAVRSSSAPPRKGSRQAPLARRRPVGLLALLLLAGDIEANPGPPKLPRKCKCGNHWWVIVTDTSLFQCVCRQTGRPLVSARLRGVLFARERIDSTFLGPICGRVSGAKSCRFGSGPRPGRSSWSPSYQTIEQTFMCCSK